MKKTYTIIYRIRNREVKRETVTMWDWQVAEYAFAEARISGWTAEIFEK